MNTLQKTIAETIKYTSEYYTEHTPSEKELIDATCETIAYNLAETLKEQNETFDVEKFMSSCGY